MFTSLYGDLTATPDLTGAQIAGAARIFTTPSEPTRLRLLKPLMGGPLTVGEIGPASPRCGDEI